MIQSILKIVVGLIATPATSLAMASVDANSGSTAELRSINGLGPTVSQAIVDERKSGKFKNWADFIKRVKGVGNARANKLSKAGLTINKMPLNN
jgi:competence protein ComEA